VVSCAKTAESMEMPFGICTGVAQEACVRWGCILAPPGEYDWTVHVRWQCSLFVKLVWPLVAYIVVIYSFCQFLIWSHAVNLPSCLPAIFWVYVLQRQIVSSKMNWSCDLYVCCSPSERVFLKSEVFIALLKCIQCLDIVDWAAGRASSL